jgi:hypothetical protein
MSDQLSGLAKQLHAALKLYPCRCQLAGGAKWHLRAQPEVEKECARCVALQRYEDFCSQSSGGSES